MFEKIKNDIAILILRIFAGGLMLVHGYPKLVKLFSDGPIQFADPIGIGMTASLVLAVFAEFLCALMIVAGVKTRFASIPLAITMFVAAFIVHGNDPWNVKEKAVLFLAMYIVLIFSGSGKYSIDRK